MAEFLVTANAGQAEDALAAIREVLEDVSHIGYLPGFPTSATWERTARNGVDVRVTLDGGDTR